MLNPKTQSEILYAYHSENKSIRKIARDFELNRKSVYRVIKRGKVVIEKSYSARGSILDEYLDDIDTLLKLKDKLSVQVIFLKLRASGYTGCYSTVRNHVREMRLKLNLAKSKEAFFTLDFGIGEASQIDWGEFGEPFEAGVKIHCFVMVLCYSRLLYVEFTRSERFEEFIRCHENAYKYFGSKRTVEQWYDNLPTAVSERKGRLVRFNSRFYAYAGHHRFKPVACNLARGNEKGRVENGVKFVRNNFWPGRTFTSFEDLQMQASSWRDEVANKREHAITKKIPRWVFESEEFGKLESVNPENYETDEIFSNEIRPSYHIVYETNRYSVPWTMVGIVVTVRVDANWLKVFYQEKFITKHKRCYMKDQKSFTKPEHEEGLKERKPQGAQDHLHWQISTLESYGPAVKEYLTCLENSPRSLKSELTKLLALGTIYGCAALEAAVAKIIKHGSFGTDRVEQFLKVTEKSKPIQPKPLSLQNEKLTKTPARVDLEYYNTRLFTNKPKTEKDEEDNGIEGSKSNT